MKYNPNFFNKGVFPRFTSVTVYAKPSYSSDVLYEIKGFAGMTDGNYENVDGWNWYRLGSIDGVHVWGWVREDYVELKTVDPINNEAAQSRLNLIIENDKNSMINLLVASRGCSMLESSGRNVSSIKNEIRNLYIDIVNRNNIIASMPNLDDKVYGEPVLDKFASDLRNIVTQNAVGIAWVPVLVIAAIVSLSLGAAYYVYDKTKTLASNSNVSYKASDKVVKKVYSSLTEEQIQILEDDINRQMKGAFTTGYWESATNITWFSILKYGAIAVGAIWVVKWIKNNF